MPDLKSTILGFGKSAAKTSSNLLNTAKLSLTLSNEETKLNAIYMEMGKKVAEIYSYGATIGDYFDEKYAELTAAQERINALKKEIDVAKGVKTCRKCGKSAPASAEFCPKCGDNIDGAAEQVSSIGSVPPQGFDIKFDEPINPQEIEPEPEFEPEPPPAPPSIDIKICGICGARNDYHDKFCLSCGRVL